MMAALRTDGSLLDRLPAVRGRYTANAPLAGITWFKVGGSAEAMFRPADADDLAVFLANRPRDVPVTVIGVGSNLLVRDGGVRGVVIRLGRGFVDVACTGTIVTAGAGALDVNVALTARDAGIAGLEFLSGIPGTIGGGLRMNAGAYRGEIKDVLIDDKLGIAAELEAQMQNVVDTYQCEWKTAVTTPEVRQRFRSFVNSDTVDATVKFVRERGQIRPARPEERDQAAINALDA